MHFSITGDKYMVNDVDIVKADMVATNGVAQGIETDLLPEFAPPKNLN